MVKILYRPKKPGPPVTVSTTTRMRDPTNSRVAVHLQSIKQRQQGWGGKKKSREKEKTDKDGYTHIWRPGYVPPRGREVNKKNARTASENVDNGSGQIL